MQSRATLSVFQLSKYVFVLLLCLFIIALPFVSEAQEEQNTKPSASLTEEDTRYISDELFIYLRAGPGPDYRLLGSITAGTRVSLLNVDREAGYAEIIDDRQRTGWVEIRFVSRIPTIRYQLEDMQAEVSSKDTQMQQMQAEVDAVMKNLEKFDSQKAELNRKISQQLEEIGRLNEQIAKRERANNMQWFTRGAILAGVSILFGYLLGLFGRKRNNSDRLM